MIPVGFAHFIARRILRPSGQEGARQLSRPIVTIAVLGVVVGMAVMIVTVAITTGFQHEVRTKVAGAGAHLQIGSVSQTDPKETPRIPLELPFVDAIRAMPEVAHIQGYATKPGIIETEGEIEGVVVKGVGLDMDWEHLRRHMVAGEVLQLSDTARSDQVLISRWMARRLGLGLNDTITIYLVRGRDDIRPRRFRVQGIYETGLEQMDHQLVFVDIGQLQRFAQWGLSAELLITDSCGTGGLEVEALAFGGDRIYRYEWPGTGLAGKGPHRICARSDTTLMVVVSDADRTLPDTAWIRITPREDSAGSCACGALAAVSRWTSGGSHKLYVGGFEVMLHPWADLMEMDERIYVEHLPLGYRSLSMRDRAPEIFAWLELLDTNVWVVIILMIVVAIINMTSALLIIILERTNMIGTLKALGASNGAVRRIFLIDAAYILGVGILLGDLLGIGFCLLQDRFALVTLPLESYYVHAVPVRLELLPLVALNVGTLVVCIAALVLPSMLVSRIAPAKAIRFA